MIQGIIGKKLGMTQMFDEKGIAEPVTAIEAGPCTVIQVKTTSKDGYGAVQLGFGAPSKKLKSPLRGHLKGLGEFQHLREFRVEDTESVKIGDKVDISLFQKGDKVDVVGTSKGKGHAGVVKRYHFQGGPHTHGQSDRERRSGAIGSTTSPGRVWKGLRMAGRMGGERVTVRHLEVLKTDAARNMLLVRGAVPGNKNLVLLVKKSSEGK